MPMAATRLGAANLDAALAASVWAMKNTQDSSSRRTSRPVDRALDSPMDEWWLETVLQDRAGG